MRYKLKNDGILFDYRTGIGEVRSPIGVVPGHFFWLLVYRGFIVSELHCCVVLGEPSSTTCLNTGNKEYCHLVPSQYLCIQPHAENHMCLDLRLTYSVSRVSEMWHADAIKFSIQVI